MENLSSTTFVCACSNNRCSKIGDVSPDKRHNDLIIKKSVPDGGWGWFVVFASFMIHFINDGVALSLGELFEQLMEKYDAGNGATSSILSVIIGTSLCTGPISSTLINVYGCRTVTIIGALIASTFIVISSYATNITTLVFTLGLGTGFGFGLSYLPALICISYYFDKYSSLATGIAVCGSGFGTIAFSSFYKLALVNFKIEQLLWVTSLLVLTCIIFSLFFRPLSSVESVKNRLTREATLLTTAIDAEKVLVVNSSHNVENKRKGGKKNCCCDESTLRLSIGGNLESVNTSDSAAAISNNKKSRLREEFENTLNELTDCAFMRNPIFVLFAASNFLTSIGFDGAFVFVPILAKEKGIDQQSSGSMLSIIGAGNIIGRIMLTYICDSFSLNRLYFYSSCISICGVITIFSVYCENIISYGIFCSIYGILISAYISFTTSITADLFGSEKLANVLGIILLFQGMAAFFGPPIAGLMCDYFQRHDPAFIFCGITLTISGLILFPIPLCQRYSGKFKTESKPNLNETENNGDV